MQNVEIKTRSGKKMFVNADVCEMLMDDGSVESSAVWQGHDYRYDNREEAFVY